MMTKTNNYLKLEGGLYNNEQTFSFDDRVKSSAQSALAAAQRARGSGSSRISVFARVRHGRLKGVPEIGKTTGASLKSVGPIDVSQTDLIGLPRAVAS